MRKLLAVLILLSASAFAGTCGNGYSYSRQFTVPAAKVPNTDQTNFPVSLAFNGTGFFNWFYLPDLATVANGGKIQNTANNSISVSGPADLIFCDAASAGNTLSFELTNYSATTGAMEAHVLIPTLSHTVATSFWMFYGNVSVVTSQQDLTLWTTAGYSEVCHFPDGASLNVACSKSAGTEVNTGSTAVSGTIGGAANTVAASNQHIDLGSSINTSTVTLEAWVNPTSFNNAAGGCRQIIANADGTNGYQLFTGMDTATNCTTNGGLVMQASGAGCCYQYVSTSSSVVPIGVWTYVVGTQTGTTQGLYANGAVVAAGSHNTPRSIGNSSQHAFLNAFPGSNTYNFDGAIDEVRISASVRSADWVTTTYNDQHSPSDFSIMFGPATGPRIVQYMDCNSAATTVNPCAFLSNVTSGNTIVVVSSSANNTTCTVGAINTLFTDTRSTTFTFAALADQVGGGTASACIAFGVLGSSGAETITASNANASPQSMTVYEISGIKSPSLDVTSTGIGGGAGSLSTGSATATTSNSLLVCGFSGSSSGTQFYTSSLTPTGTSYLNTIAAPGGAGSRGGTAAIQFTGSGSKNCTFTLAGPGPTNTAAALAVIKYSSVTSKRRQSQIY